MPYYDFFLSYASTDWRKGQKDDLEVFFKDLKAKLSSVGHIAGGFMAPAEIERGKDWEATLVAALARSRVIVPLYSPNYFRSASCGKEWQVFSDRYADNRRQLPAGVNGPEVMVPIIWTADLLNVPGGVTKIQFKNNDHPKYVEKGLAYLMRNPRKYRTHYEEFVDRIGNEVAVMAERQGGSRVRPVRPWKDIDPLFPATFRRGLGYVRYFFVAGLQDEMALIRQERAAYGTFENRQDWRPCFPDVDRQAGDLARGVAAEAGKEYEIVEGADFSAKVQEAKDLNNILAVVVDPWSIDLPAFASLTDQLDSQAAPASGVVVVWNEKDAETKHQLPILKNRMDDRFRGRIKRQEYFTDAVTSPETFRDALSATFNAAHERLIEQGSLPSAASGSAAPPPLPTIKS